MHLWQHLEVKTYQHLVESAFYSQYPNAEIREIDDYMEKFHIDAYHNENGEYDLFGTEWKMAKDSVKTLLKHVHSTCFKRKKYGK